MFFGINIFWALYRAHFNPRLTARAKMSLSQTQNMFMPLNVNCIVLFYQFIHSLKFIRFSLCLISSHLKLEMIA